MNKRRTERLPAPVNSREHRERSDAELARALAEGHGWAAGETWHRLAPMVLALSERYLGSKSEAEDVTQEVFHRLFRNAAALRDPRSLRSFAYRFAVHALHMELRRRKRGAWLKFEEPEMIADLRAFVPDVESRDLLARLTVLIGRLKPRERISFLLKRIDAMTLEEIAQELEIPVSRVKRLIRSASSKLTFWIDQDPELVALLPAAAKRRVRPRLAK